MSLMITPQNLQGVLFLQYTLGLIKCFYFALASSRRIAASYVSVTRAIHRRYEFNVALIADVSLASTRMVTVLSSSSKMWTLDLEVVGFPVSGCMAFSTVSDSSLDGKARVIVAALFIVDEPTLGVRL